MPVWAVMTAEIQSQGQQTHQTHPPPLHPLDHPESINASHTQDRAATGDLVPQMQNTTATTLDIPRNCLLQSSFSNTGVPRNESRGTRLGTRLQQPMACCDAIGWPPIGLTSTAAARAFIAPHQSQTRQTPPNRRRRGCFGGCVSGHWHGCRV